MAAMAPHNTNTSSPTPSGGMNIPSVGLSVAGLSGIVLPALINNMSSMQHLIMPNRPEGIEPSASSAPSASPVLNEHGAPMQLSGWETRNGPVNQIMQAIGHSTSGFLKLLVGIIRLIPGLGRN